MFKKLSRRNWLKSSIISSASFMSLFGVSYGKAKNKSSGRKKKYPELEYDVVVCGGGPGGIGAAVAAARLKKRVLLIERYGFLGGVATAGLIQSYMGYGWEKKIVIKGIFNEIQQRLRKRNAYSEVRPGLPRGIRSRFNAEVLKIVEQELCLENDVELLYHAFVNDVDYENNSIKSVTAATKGGDIVIKAKVFVDATGDGDVAYLSNAEFEFGRKEDGLTQTATLAAFVTKKEGINAAGLRSSQLIKYDGTNPFDLTKMQIEGLKEIDEIFRSRKSNNPAYKDAFIQKIAPQVGIRETRRIIGDYILNKDDLLSLREFPDKICRGCFMIDVHNPTGKDNNDIYQVFLQEGTSYTIPYRSLLVKGKDNLIMGCRAVSSTHEAHSAIRVQAIVMAMGQAAGTAAALSINKQNNLRNVSITELQDTLRRADVIL